MNNLFWYVKNEFMDDCHTVILQTVIVFSLVWSDRRQSLRYYVAGPAVSHTTRLKVSPACIPSPDYKGGCNIYQLSMENDVQVSADQWPTVKIGRGLTDL